MYKNIKITAAVYTELDQVKGKETFSAYIGLMLAYFKTLGVHPRSLLKHPMEEMNKGFDRVIALIKGMEKTKLNPILDMIKQVQFSGSLPYDEAQFITKEDAETLSKQVHEVAGKNEKLAKELAGEKKKSDDLLEENLRLKRQLREAESSSNGNVDTGKMLELLDWLSQNTRKSVFSNDLTITGENLNNFIGRMKSCIK